MELCQPVDVINNQGCHEALQTVCLELCIYTSAVLALIVSFKYVFEDMYTHKTSRQEASYGPLYTVFGLKLGCNGAAAPIGDEVL